MPTTADYLGDLVNLRKELANALSANPTLVKASEDETFSTLIDKAVRVMNEFNKVTNNRTSMNRAFADSPITTIPKIPTANCENFEGMCEGCKSLINVNDLDVSKGTSFFYMFSGSSALLSVGSLDTRMGKRFDGMFANCSNLRTIESIDFTSATSFEVYVTTLSTFYNCRNLVDMNVKGSIPISFPIGSCSNLSNESAKSIIRALVDYSNTKNADKYNVTFHANVKTRLTDEGNTSPNGNTWVEYIVDKGWKVG